MSDFLSIEMRQWVTRKGVAARLGRPFTEPRPAKVPTEVINQREYLKAKQKRKENPEKFRERDRGYNLKKVHDMTLDEYNALAQEQGHVCAICGNPNGLRRDKSGPKKLAVDHNHISGKRRGLLCDRCNWGLYFLELMGWLEKAIAYLRKYDG